MRLIVNPRAGGCRAARLRYLRQNWPGGDLVVAHSREQFDGMVSESRERHADRLAVAGGDGTLHRALQCLVHSATALAIVPLGTGNDMARAFGIPLALDHSLATCLNGATAAVDVARISVANHTSYFGCVASAGLDSAANALVNRIHARWPRISRVMGRWIYPLSATLELLRQRPREIEITLADSVDRSLRRRAWLLAVANARSYGGGLAIAPAARVDDGELDIVLIHDHSRLWLVRHVWDLYSGTHVGLPGVEVTQAKRIAIRSHGAWRVCGDGEEIGWTPVSIEICPGALRIVR